MSMGEVWIFLSDALRYLVSAGMGGPRVQLGPSVVLAAPFWGFLPCWWLCIQ